MTLNVHLVFKTHLDVGFTQSAAAVTREYFTRHIPAALALARQMRQAERADRFIWTTGSWLIYEYLEQADATGRKAMEESITAGDIAWHALPFTTHTELMDVELFRFGLELSQRLDKRFGRRTIAAKFTDVPGHTRAIIPLMAEAGVQFLQIGVNPGSTVPAVPPLFRWQDPDTGQELMVMYESGYGNAFILPGGEEALAFGHSSDNLGPQNMGEVDAIYQHLRLAYPGAQVFASTLNTFAEKLTPIRTQLPVLGQEIGDSWIHGVGSDPIKVSQFRELLRLRQEWLADNPAIRADPHFDRFHRSLLLVPEHTWGMDEKTFLGDHDHYAAGSFAAARTQENFRTFAASWAEKRAYIETAVAALGSTPQGVAARARLTAIRNVQPALDCWQEITVEQQQYADSSFVFGFDPQTGALNRLVSQSSGQSWAGVAGPLGWLRYQTFSAVDYERFFHQYIRPEEQANGWSREDFTKPGLENAHPIGRFWQPQVTAAFRRANQYLFILAGIPQSVTDYGCPRTFYLLYRFNPEASEIEIELQWFDKPACRLPEATWFSFAPPVSTAAAWQIHKLGRNISPLEVVANGNRHLHACGQGVSCTDGSRTMVITALDSPLVAPGEPALLNFTNDQPDQTRGMHFNLHNNLWGTNFPMWFEEDCRFRFKLAFQ